MFYYVVIPRKTMTDYAIHMDYLRGDFRKTFASFITLSMIFAYPLPNRFWSLHMKNWPGLFPAAYLLPQLILTLYNPMYIRLEVWSKYNTPDVLPPPNYEYNSKTVMKRDHFPFSTCWYVNRAISCITLGWTRTCTGTNIYAN